MARRDDPIGVRDRITDMRIKSLTFPAGAAVVVAAVAFGVANHGGNSRDAQSTTVVTGGAAAITIKNYAFAPPSLAIKVGTHITWTNHDATAHTATADRGSWDTGTINPGQGKTLAFQRAGTYTYHCAFHAFMTGTITVVR